MKTECEDTRPVREGVKTSEDILFWVTLGMIALLIGTACLAAVDHYIIDLPVWLWPD